MCAVRWANRGKRLLASSPRESDRAGHRKWRSVEPRGCLKERFEIMPSNHAVQRRHGRRPMVAQQGKVDVVAVEMDDVEMARLPEDQFHQPDMVRQRLAALWVPPKGTFAARHQRCAGYRISAGNQRNVVALPYQLFRQIAHDPLRAANQPRRACFAYSGNL